MENTIPTFYVIITLYWLFKRTIKAMFITRNLMLQIFVLIFFTAIAQAQPKQGYALTDSLLTVLKTAKEDSNKVNLLHNLCVNRTVLGDYAGAFTYANESLILAKKIDFKKGIADSYYQIGNVSSWSTDYPKAVDFFLKALTLYEQLEDKHAMASVFVEIGDDYRILGDFPKALQYLQKGLTTHNALNNKPGVADAYNYLGRIYQAEGNYADALKNYFLCLNYYKEDGDQRSIAISYDCIGTIYQEKGNYPEALKYQQGALKIRESLGAKWGISISNSNMGYIYFLQGKYPEALKYVNMGLSVALEIGQKQSIAKAYNYLASIDSAMNNFRGAYENQKRFKAYNDSIFNIQNNQKITSLAMNYEFAKLQDSAKAEQAKKDAIAINELQKQKLVRNGFIGGFVVVLLFAVVFFTQRNKIKVSKKRSDELLLNILPEEVAEELKVKGSADAKLFEEVTVMFTDFKGFTQISEKLSPTELVAEIHTCFKSFDDIISKYNIEKIKTIGDSYMCAGGLPLPNKTNAIDVVNAAIEIQNFVEEYSLQSKSNGKEIFEIRIGVHTGPVVAGIVGVKKFAYDIWGDTVNIASRMESSGEAGKVNISGSTYALVKDKFYCTYRGKIQAKNKGEIEMYFVERNE